MEKFLAIYDKHNRLLGDVEKAEECKGWFAHIVNEENLDCYAETFHCYKKDAVAWVKRESKKYIK